MSRTWFGRSAPPEGRTGMPPRTEGPPARPYPPEATVTAPSEAEPLVTIDALGRKCPIPIIMLAEQIRDVPVGAVIAVLADDPAAYTDVPAWCGMKSHELVFRCEHEQGWAFGVRRSY
jgi:tRNA 2-thiouridine synthesizing protein A